MLRKSMILLGTLAVATSLCLAQEKAQQPAIKQTPIKQISAASGKEMFAQYCAPCHGPGGKGDGPAASAMKTAPADLTKLTKTHDGKFPADHLAAVLKFGSGPSAHGSKDMPVWGPLFQSLDKYHESAVQQRVSNLVGYIETLQVK